MEHEQSQTSGWNLHYFGDINQKKKLISAAVFLKDYTDRERL